MTREEVHVRRGTAIIAALVVLLVDARYCWLVWRGDAAPVLATWLLFAVAVSLSFATYWASEKHSIVGNIGNAVDVVGVWAILLFVALLGKHVRLGFSPFELGCLVASGLILLLWRASKLHATSNLALQVVMTVAYFPTIAQLWGATSSTEPLAFWTAIWVSAVLTLVPAIIDRDRLACAYAGRAVVMVSVLIALMLRIQLR